MPDYIPGKDAEFDIWQLNFVNYVNANFAALGLTMADLLPTQTANTNWTPVFANHIVQRNAAEAATAAKDDSRDALEAAIRGLVAKIQAIPTVTNAQKAAMQITRKDAPQPDSGAGPDSRPLVAVDTSARLKHTLSWVEESSGKKARPSNVRGTEIWIKIGEPAPAGPADMRFLVLDTASPYPVAFDQADGGKRAHYLARWQLKDGTFLTWSELASATIPA